MPVTRSIQWDHPNPIVYSKSIDFKGNGPNIDELWIIPLLFPYFPIYWTQKVSVLKKYNTPKQQHTCFCWKGTCFFLKKKAPARNAPVVVRACFHQKSKILGILTKIIPFPGKVQKAKWRHKVSLSNANLLFEFVHEINSFWRNSTNIDYLPIIYLLFIDYSTF